MQTRARKKKQTGIHWGMLMQLARLGGMSGLPIILPEKVDGYVQAIRDKNISTEAQVGDSASSFANAGVEKEYHAVKIDPYTETVEFEMEVRNYAGFSADESHSVLKPPVVTDDITVREDSNNFPPLKSCVDQVVEFPDVLGIVPDDFQLVDCTESKEPLRVLLNPTDDWAYSVISTSYHAQIPRVMAEFEYEVENFRTALQLPVPQRLIPFVRFTMAENADYDFGASFIEAFETLIEVGASRGKNEARMFLGNLGELPTRRAGRR